MKQNETKKFCEIPPIDGNTILGSDEICKTKCYFLVLQILPTNKKFSKFEVTDFTSNVQLNDEIGKDEKNYRYLCTDDNKVLEIVVHQDKLDPISGWYEEEFPGLKLNLAQDVRDNNGQVFVDDKVLIMAMTLRWREYHGKLEPYTYDPEVIKWEPENMTEKDQQVVIDLYRNILQQRDYVQTLQNKASNRLQKIIPAEFYQQFYINKNYSYKSVQKNTNDTGKANENSNTVYQPTEEVDKSSKQNEEQSQVKNEDEEQTQVKNEINTSQAGVSNSVKVEPIISTTILPVEYDEDIFDNLSSSDENLPTSSTASQPAQPRLEEKASVNMAEQKLDSEEEEEELPITEMETPTHKRSSSEQSQLQSQPNKRHRQNVPGGFISIQDLNDANYLKLEIDNKVYKILCQIIGTKPEDLALVCGKELVKNKITKKMELGDPIIAGLSLLIAEPNLPSGSELYENDFLEIELTDQDVLKLFKCDRIEELYLIGDKIEIDYKQVYELEIMKKDFGGIILWGVVGGLY
ncbi:hypothetical protein KGF54_002947 [Candida jiufengensis]|uniref:uncharacterized protein n=1 Tax=Candida jiufengensis TaxID=497108 RepID=UPI002224FDB8|nr:uncharacterized protein KGF54_002947 [Candida jiufengensis]KAI5953575.1 hypothetical protein KGF54_002947 [Candida jiufengensis]